MTHLDLFSTYVERIYIYPKPTENTIAWILANAYEQGILPTTLDCEVGKIAQILIKEMPYDKDSHIPASYSNVLRKADEINWAFAPALYFLVRCLDIAEKIKKALS